MTISVVPIRSIYFKRVLLFFSSRQYESGYWAYHQQAFQAIVRKINMIYFQYGIRQFLQQSSILISYKLYVFEVLDDSELTTVSMQHRFKWWFHIIRLCFLNMRLCLLHRKNLATPLRVVIFFLETVFLKLLHLPQLDTHEEGIFHFIVPSHIRTHSLFTTYSITDSFNDKKIKLFSVQLKKCSLGNT